MKKLCTIHAQQTKHQNNDITIITDILNASSSKCQTHTPANTWWIIKNESMRDSNSKRCKHAQAETNTIKNLIEEDMGKLKINYEK